MISSNNISSFDVKAPWGFQMISIQIVLLPYPRLTQDQAVRLTKALYDSNSLVSSKTVHLLHCRSKCDSFKLHLFIKIECAIYFLTFSVHSAGGVPTERERGASSVPWSRQNGEWDDWPKAVMSVRGDACMNLRCEKFWYVSLGRFK